MELDLIDQRVLGSLLEKERTVPATYPLTLHALRSACNQTSGRDPIVEVAEHEVLAAVDRLKALGLARIVHAGAGSRATKYRQVADERLQLDPAERAVLTLLLLRGAQTPGELRSRSDRLHEFAELAAVEAALRSLSARDEPLVAEQERRPGQKERRWVHRLGPAAAGPPASGPAPVAGPALVAEPVDGWVLVRVEAHRVDEAVAAVVGLSAGEGRATVLERGADDVLDLLGDDDRVYVVGRIPT